MLRDGRRADGEAAAALMARPTVVDPFPLPAGLVLRIAVDQPVGAEPHELVELARLVACLGPEAGRQIRERRITFGQVAAERRVGLRQLLPPDGLAIEIQREDRATCAAQHQLAAIRGEGDRAPQFRHHRVGTPAAVNRREDLQPAIFVERGQMAAIAADGRERRRDRKGSDPADESVGRVVIEQHRAVADEPPFNPERQHPLPIRHLRQQLQGGIKQPPLMPLGQHGIGGIHDRASRVGWPCHRRRHLVAVVDLLELVQQAAPQIADDQMHVVHDRVLVALPREILARFQLRDPAAVGTERVTVQLPSERLVGHVLVLIGFPLPFGDDRPLLVEQPEPIAQVVEQPPRPGEPEEISVGEGVVVVGERAARVEVDPRLRERLVVVGELVEPRARGGVGQHAILGHLQTADAHLRQPPREADRAVLVERIEVVAVAPRAEIEVARGIELEMFDHLVGAHLRGHRHCRRRAGVGRGVFDGRRLWLAGLRRWWCCCGCGGREEGVDRGLHARRVVGDQAECVMREVKSLRGDLHARPAGFARLPERPVGEVAMLGKRVDQERSAGRAEHHERRIDRQPGADQRL